MRTLKSFLLVTFLVTGICAIAQEKAMFIYKNDAIVKTIKLSQIDSITFTNVSSQEGCDIVHFFLDIYKDDQSSYTWRGDVQMQDIDQDPPLVKIDSKNGIITYSLPILPGWFTPAKMNVFPAVIEVSEGATIEPNWNVPQDFSKDVVYTVTGKNGAKKIWTVKAPKHYIKEKWNKNYTAFNPSGDQNPNSIAIIGNYLAVSRQLFLINKSDGTLASGELNTTGLADGNNNAAQPWPFFVTNDDAGNMLGGTLNAWNNNAFYVFKWKNATDNPELLMKFDTKDGAGTVTSGFGRKFQVIGDANNKGLIIASNIAGADVEVLKDQGEHYVWKITNGVTDTNNPSKLKTNIRWDNNNYGYQLLTPLGTDVTGPYYVGTHTTTKDSAPFYPNLHFGNLGDMKSINGPFELGTSTANGWGNQHWFYHKVFTFDSKNMIATFTGSASDYCFALLERVGNEHVPVATAKIGWVSGETPNGNGTGSMTMEKIGNDVFFYVFPTNKAIICYQLGKF